MIGIILNTSTVVQYFCLSVALQTFYRKSFNMTNVPQFLCFFALGILPPLASFWGEAVFNFFSTVLIPLAWFATCRWRDNFKLLNLFLLLIIFLEYDYHPLINSPELAITAQLVVSLTQLNRRPLSFKNNRYVRKTRIFMGPVYVLYSVRSFCLVHRNFGSTYPSLGALIFANAVLAFVGGVFFRPDNDFLLKPWKTNQQDRRLRHRNCMILSAVTSLLCVSYIWIWISYKTET